jgi:hypothetical protein
VADPTRRRRVLAALIVRLQTIAVASGYETDAGQVVFVNETPAFGDDDPDVAIAVQIGDEDQQWQQPGKAWQIALPVEVQGLVRVGLEDGWLLVEALIGDIKRALEQEDTRLGGLLDFPMERGGVRTLDREAGSTDMGATLTYTVRFKEGWGHP